MFGDWVVMIETRDWSYQQNHVTGQRRAVKRSGAGNQTTPDQGWLCFEEGDKPAPVKLRPQRTLLGFGRISYYGPTPVLTKEENIRDR